MTNITADQLVQREVVYCVSYLISDLVKQDKYMDDLLPVCIQDDWETPALDNGWEKENNRLSAQDWCMQYDIEPQTNEAYEHWIVTGWLADKLEAEGEMIVRDFLGMTIWGRACTGQMIAMDNVIQKIHHDLVSGGHAVAAKMDAFINARG